MSSFSSSRSSSPSSCLHFPFVLSSQKNPKNTHTHTYTQETAFQHEQLFILGFAKTLLTVLLLQADNCHCLIFWDWSSETDKGLLFSSSSFFIFLGAVLIFIFFLGFVT